MDKKINLTDYIDVLNDAALKLAKYEGFFPDRFLIEDDGSNYLTLKIVPTSDGNKTSSSFELKINKVLSFDQSWFKFAAESQIAIYQSILDVIKKLDDEQNIFEFSKDNKYVVKNKKACKSNDIQSQLQLVELNNFRILSKFKNYSIGNFVSIKSKETIDTIRQEINSLTRVMIDSSSRLEFFETAPIFNVVEETGLNNQNLKITLNDEEIFNESFDWKQINKDDAYVKLVNLCYIAKAMLNTLDFYREVSGLTQPSILVSKTFSKKWKVTVVGQQYLTCLQLPTLIKEVYKLKK